MCDHIIGYEEGVDESWLVYASEGWSKAPYPVVGDVVFKFCSLCGEKLENDKGGK